MTKKELLTEQLDEIMDTFDFALVARLRPTIREHLGLKPDPDEGEQEFRKIARRMMKNVIDMGGGHSSTAGFTAIVESGVEDGKEWSRLLLFYGLDSLIQTGDGVFHD